MDLVNLMSPVSRTLFASRRLRLFASHVFISAAAVGTLAALLLLVWYPGPLFTLQGAAVILMIVVFVDVVIGPLLTLIIASPKKGRRELTRDLAIIGAIQVAALLYGAHSLFVARPAFIVFDADRFDVVTANELVRDVPFPYRDQRFASTPLFGPLWVAATPPDSTEERNRLLFSAVQGGPQTRDHPALYEAWPPKQGINIAKLKPLRELVAASNEGNQAASDAVFRSGLQENDLAYVWLVGRAKIGVVMIDRKTLAIVLASAVKPTDDVK
jgi:hypothetical protein